MKKHFKNAAPKGQRNFEQSRPQSFGRDIVCGINSVIEVVRAGRRQVHCIFVAEGRHGGPLDKLLDLARAKNVRVSEVPRSKIDDLTRVETNQGVAAEVEPFKYVELEELLRDVKSRGETPFLVLLDQINDPHNVGAIIRTAHLMGAHGLIIPKDNAAQIGPTVSKSASGGVEYLPIVKVTNLNAAINILKDNNIWVVGADGETTKTIYDYDFTGPSAIVMGGEGKGLRRLVKEHCDELLAIPMSGHLDSFNVSVASAIFMAELTRQRMSKKHAKKP